MKVLSVIMPTYNVEKWVATTIDNLAAQTYPHFELIVVDDGSKDGTLDAVRSRLSMLRNKSRVIELGANRGPSAARNVGLRAAAGSWVQFLDSDDFMAPRKFELQIRHCLEAPANLSAVYSAWQWCFYDDGRIVPEGAVAWPRPPAREPLMCLAGINRPLLGAGIARRSILEELLGFDESLRFWEAEEMFVRLARAGRLEVVASDEPLYLWRMHRDKPYIGDGAARYQATPVALGWLDLVLQQTAGRLMRDLQLTDAERAILHGDVTEWARILYAHDRTAFRKFVVRLRELEPQIAPAYPRFATHISGLLGYEAAERVAQLSRIPGSLKRRASKLLSAGRTASAAPSR